MVSLDDDGGDVGGRGSTRGGEEWLKKRMMRLWPLAIKKREAVDELTR
jgi:hypothetical protein